MTAEVNVSNSNTLALVGDVTSDNVVAIRRKGDGMISKMPSTCIIDLAELKSANTITLSLLLAWLRSAMSRNTTLTIIRPPGKLFDMARVSGLESILPFESMDC